MIVQLSDYIEQKTGDERVALRLAIHKHLDHANTQELRAMAARLSWLAEVEADQESWLGDPNNAPCPEEPDEYSDAAYHEHVGQSWGVFTLCRDHLSEHRVQELCRLLSDEVFSDG